MNNFAVHSTEKSPAAVIANLQAWAQPVGRFQACVATHPVTRAAHSATEHLTDPTLWLYRGRTCALLRRFLRMSVEVGRVPSLLGREFFRSRINCSRAATFEDAVIFVHDVEKCLDHLDDFQKALIARIIFQEYTQEETANMLQCHVRTVGRRFTDTLDRLSFMFLHDEMLARLPDTTDCGKPCQEDRTRNFRPSASQQNK